MNRPAHRTAFIVFLGLAVGSAVVLYRPILRIGLLSDDYALLMWAERLDLIPRDWGQIRPLPILLWSLAAALTAPATTPAILHIVNVVLHGVNAALVGVLATRIIRHAPDPEGTPVRHGHAALAFLAPVLAGLLFLAMPVAVEPVAWASGVFDVLLATLALALAVIAAGRPRLTLAEQALTFLIAVAMLATKETGVIAAPLLLLVHWVRWGRLDRSVATVALAQFVLAVTYVLTREVTGMLDHRLTPRPDLQSIGRLLAGIGRLMLLPLHRDVITAYPYLAVAGAVAVVLVLTTWLIRSRRSPHMLRVAILAVAGTLVCVGPTIRIFGITPDLQGTRYVYLASAWWSIALAAAFVQRWGRPSAHLVTLGVALLTVGGAIAATRAHLQPWVAARHERDRVLLKLISLHPSCRKVAATSATDNVAGAYVFRNGLNEALGTLGRSYEWVPPEQADPDCRVSLEP